MTRQQGAPMRLTAPTGIAALVPAIVLIAGLALGFASPARAIVNPGDVAPNFTKQQLDYPSVGLTTPRSLADYSGKVIVFFLLGYG